MSDKLCSIPLNLYKRALLLFEAQQSFTKFPVKFPLLIIKNKTIFSFVVKNKSKMLLWQHCCKVNCQLEKKFCEIKYLKSNE